MLVNALIYYFRAVLNRDSFEIKLPRPRGEHHLPTVLIMEECFRIFSFVDNPKHKVLYRFLWVDTRHQMLDTRQDTKDMRSAVFCLLYNI